MADVDMDIDLGMDVDDFSIEQAQEDGQISESQQNNLTQPTTLSTSLEPELMAPAPEKVHLRGLDNLTSKDITAFVNEYSAHPFERVEWIDDTSANIIYADADLALSALQSFVDVADVPLNPGVLDMFPAKSFPGFPDTRLMVRLAVIGDRKQPGARERSRFYLLNPEHDRRDEAPRGDRAARGGRRPYRDRDGEYKRGYNERGSGRLQRDAPAFDESLYDDDAATLAKRRSVDRDVERDLTPPSTERSRPRGRGGRRELFPERGGRGSGRLRDRSASPLRERDGDAVMDDLAADHRAKRTRESGNANRLFAQVIKTQLKSSSAPGLELFPEKATRKRSAFEEGDKAADLFADKLRLPSSDSRGGLESRITGRLNNDGGNGFKIRGAAAQPKAELSIKGMASGGRSKELFPAKAALNTGKELFSERIDGRGGRRQKADDLFH